MTCVTRYDKNIGTHTLFTLCSCHNEILLIEYDHDIKMADLAIYERGVCFKTKMSLWQKIRYCWKVLYSGRPYSDEIMLDKKQLLEIKSFIDSL